LRRRRLSETFAGRRPVRVFAQAVHAQAARRQSERDDGGISGRRAVIRISQRRVAAQDFAWHDCYLIMMMLFGATHARAAVCAVSDGEVEPNNKKRSAYSGARCASGLVLSYDGAM